MHVFVKKIKYTLLTGSILIALCYMGAIRSVIESPAAETPRERIIATPILYLFSLLCRASPNDYV